ncbi:MAG: hypothetical protein JW754_04665 [Candidatus Aenigmarchaeota archaeon]|nr:hypothetical protein [Candidatus Aenigmarchaeota archaeon]
MGVRKKGSFMQPSEIIVTIIIALLAGSIFIIGGTNYASGPLATARDQICKYVPFLCGSQASEGDYEISLKSYECLACAISVVSGSGNECAKNDCQMQQALPSGEGLPFSAQQVGDPDEGEKSDTDIYAFYKAPVLKCEEDKGICFVENFQLPQDVTGFEKWIKGNGDPQFLVYWEVFPDGVESAWSGFALWTENVFDLMLGSWVVGKGLAIGKSAITTTTSRVGTGLATKMGLKAGSAVTAETSGLTFDMIDDVSKPLLKEISSNVGSVSMKKLAARGIKSESVALLGAALDSLMKKYDLHDHSLLIKSPYDDPVPIQVEKGGPVFLERTKDPLYLVSPCIANLVVKKTNIKCGSYSYSEDLKYYKCTGEKDIKVKDSDVEKIGLCTTDVSDNFKKPETKKYAEMIEKIDTTQEAEIFEWTDDVFMVRDPIKNIKYYFKDKDSKKKVIEKIVYTDSNGEVHEFNINGMETFTENGFEIKLEHGGECEPKKENNFKCKNFGIEIKQFPQDCDYCQELSEYYGDLDDFRMSYDKQEMEVEDPVTGIKSKVYYYYSHVQMYFESGETAIVFTNMNDDTIADTITIDDDASFFRDIWETFGLASKWARQPKVTLTDTNFPKNNGIFDIIIVRDCVVPGQLVEVTKIDDDNYDRNFCHSYETIATKAFGNAVWIGGGVGCVVGGVAGAIGGAAGGGGVGGVPGAIGGCKAGGALGFKIGAVVQTGYAIYERAHGVPDIWPGN